uniref:TIL domain-containing protein n=1 Tax=Meloidogyne incognita TaxID=6306 RepID=A0A914MJJ3_MELIC
MLKHQNILINHGILLILCLSKSYAQDSGCKEGEELKPCGSACEPTCNDTGDSACTLQCIIDVCQCKDGYVRDENKICIPKENCPKLPTPECTEKPSQNDCSLIDCLSGYECKIIYGQPKCVPIACNLLCRIGYLCKIINGKPTCVPKCSKGEEYKECPTACEPKCGQKPIFCPAVCLKPPRCQCLPGYARTSDGICVPRNDCPQNVTTEVPPSTTPLSCGEGEEARNCPVCEATCARKRPICPLYCPLLQRCLCKQGYARVAKGKCIPIEQCPEEPTTQKPCILPCPLGSLCKFVNGEPTCVRAKDCSRINCGIAYTCKVIDGGTTCVPL